MSFNTAMECFRAIFLVEYPPIHSTKKMVTESISTLREKNRKKLQRAESRGCPNVSAYLKLLDAEELSVRKLTAPRIVSVAYDRAIDAMAAAGRPHMEALANKRAAYFQVKQGNRAEAEKDFERAVHLYKYEWGGNAKHDWLTEESIAALSTIGDNKTGVVLGGVVGFGTDDWVDG